MATYTWYKDHAKPYIVEWCALDDTGDAAEFATKAEAIAYIRSRLEKDGEAALGYRIITEIPFTITTGG